MERLVVVSLTPPAWAPPGIDAARWRRALADDAVDLLATLAEVEPALAVAEAEASLAAAVAWPGMKVYALPNLSPRATFDRATEDGFEQAAIIAPDAPDLPGMLIAKMLRPLGSRPTTAAPASGEPRGLVGLATRLPVPAWLPEVNLDTATVADIRATAPHVADVIGTPGWHRLRRTESLSRLDPATEGWDAIRALLTAGDAIR